MVFAVQCPNAKCRKFMLVEEHARNSIVKCLLCKTDIRIISSDPNKAAGKSGNSGKPPRP